MADRSALGNAAVASGSLAAALGTVPEVPAVSPMVVVDLLLGAALAGLGLAILGLEISAVRARCRDRADRPMLPVADRPPAGLGRFAPITAAEISAEVERGLEAISLHLTERARRA